jgi:hypothetical protein
LKKQLFDLEDNLSSVSQNVLKFDQQLTGEERRIPFFFDDFHFCRSRVIGLDMTENMIFTLCRMMSTDRRTDGHGETSIPPYNFVVGGIKMLWPRQENTIEKTII